MKIHKTLSPLQRTRYFKGEAYDLISWKEDEQEALATATRISRHDKVEVVLSNSGQYGVYRKRF